VSTSDPANKRWTVREIAKLSPQSVLDVGPGEGHYLEFIKGFVGDDIRVDGIEIWEPYVERFQLDKRYDNLYVGDVRNHENFDYDLVVFGDVLEHMSEEDALRVWDKASKQARYAIISIPIIHHPQGVHDSNPYEVHVEEDWSTKKVLDSFHSIVDYKEFDVTGVFIAKFIGNEVKDDN
jgi:SAM-dependent methyltransferase